MSFQPKNAQLALQDKAIKSYIEIKSNSVLVLRLICDFPATLKHKPRGYLLKTGHKYKES